HAPAQALTPAKAGAPGANGWHRFSLSESELPENADRFALVLITEARDGEAAWWDGAQLYGEYERVPKVGVYYNQVGYESQGPKCFTAYSNFAPASATFEIRSDTGESVYGGSLGSAEKITDINGRDWDYYYLRGEFTDFERGGAYRIRVTLDGHSAESDVFDIAKDLLWDKVLPVALNHFTYQRSGVEIPNFQAAAHLDDAVDPETKEALPLSGGWYDNGLGAKLTNPYVLWKLAQAYDAAAWRFDALDTNRDGVNDILGELVWGADYVKRLLSHETTAYQGVQATPDYSGPFGRDTDNAPGTADDRHAEHTDDTALHLAGLACLARYVKDRQPYVDTVAKALDRDLAAGWRGPGQFAAAMNLYLATREDRFGERAQELFPGVDLEFVDSINAHDDEFGSFSTIEIGMKFTTQADALLRLADNPFGVCTYGPPNKPVFFSGPDGKDGAADGNTQYVLQAAEFMARTYRFAPKPEYLRFIHNQLNWLLGDNPFGLCLVEGLGHERAPAYHDLRVFTGTRRGAMPGAIAKGIGPKGPGDDRPYFDLRDVDLPESRTNACDIRNNALMVSTIAHLKRFRFAAMPPR
ncbi:MAG TPA: glycoside hydrolase family 9 protein, partial [Candidatus Hydrogenedentes bacterium]|nr:glycoside hydrolase family 9 protein [Candidatus Hydrogenedentota bacterium]